MTLGQPWSRTGSTPTVRPWHPPPPRGRERALVGTHCPFALIAAIQRRELHGAINVRTTPAMAPTPTPTDVDSDVAIEPISPAERALRASRIKDLTFGQFKAIRTEALNLGVPPEVASMLPWYPADPQLLVAALRSASGRQEVVARNILGVIVEFDVLTAVILRSLENLRAEHDRYQGKFAIARYTSTDGDTALLADLTGHDSPQAAFTAVQTQLQVVDEHISALSPYGHDIKVNGIRRGGVLFPVVLDLPDGRRIGGLESTDSYSRTMFAQHHSGITVSAVLESWLMFPPTTPREFAHHPIKKARDILVRLAKAIVADPEAVGSADVSRVLRAVMPKTAVVLAVSESDGVHLDEVRRRLVSERHLDKQVEFTDETKNETRAEAVITEFDRLGLLPTRPGTTAADTLQLLENPRAVIGQDGVHRDDLMVAAAAVFLPEKGTKQDRLIFPSIRNRGVITPDDQRKKWLRSELAAQVIMRSIPEDIQGRGLRKSALERALRQPKLRGATMESRPVDELLAQALTELEGFNQARQRGESPGWPPAMLQLALRGGFYLFFGHNLALGRSPVGGKKGDDADNREPTQILEQLATMKRGLNLLAQAINDGRNGVPVRLLADGAGARNITTPPTEAETLDNNSLREWLGTAVKQEQQDLLGTDRSARHRVHTAQLELRSLTGQLQDKIDLMAGYADEIDGVEESPREHVGDAEPSNATQVGPPYVQVHGLRDADGLAVQLKQASETLSEWHMRFRLRGAGTGGVSA